jgi:hypothetical protein
LSLQAQYLLYCSSNWKFQWISPRMQTKDVV